MCNRGVLLATSLLGYAALALPTHALATQAVTNNLSDAIIETDGTATVTTSPAVILRATASRSGSTAEIWYSFSVVGPESSQLVPISIAGTLSGVSTPDQPHGDAAGVSVELRVDAYDEAIKWVNTPDGLEPFADSWSGALLVHAFANVGGNVFIAAVAEGYSAYAYADPVISIDPSFAAIDPNYLKDYSIQLSAGIGNALPMGAPEPSTWAMMAIGFVGLGFAGYRSRKAISIAA